jgi:ribosome maturation factor RimP
VERIDERLYDLTAELVAGMGFTLVTVDDVVEHGRRTFRFTIDHERGITVEDCAGVSREIAYLLDDELALEARYVLEVSSPGLDHALRKEREYAHFTGREARLVVREPVDGENVLTGTILGAEKGSVRLDVDGTEIVVPLENVSRARLVM